MWSSIGITFNLLLPPVFPRVSRGGLIDAEFMLLIRLKTALSVT